MTGAGRPRDGRDAAPCSRSDVPSLLTLVKEKLCFLLKTSNDGPLDALVVADNLTLTCLQQLLNDPTTPYQVLRLFDDLPLKEYDGRRAVDVDEAVLQTERYIRGLKGDAREKDDFLVGLDELQQIIPGAWVDDTRLYFKRRDPPKGGLEVLDELRRQKVSIWATSAAFVASFHQCTGNILFGLDWSDIIVAGGTVLSILLTEQTPSLRIDPSSNHSALDLYIHGLTAEGALRRVEHIYS